MRGNYLVRGNFPVKGNYLVRGNCMKSLEQFKNEITEEGKSEFFVYMKEQTAKGRTSAEAAAEYIRSKGYDVTEADLQPLDDDDLENVSGGIRTVFPDKCKHENKVRTGRERDDSYYIFWTAHYVEYECTECGYKMWIDED